MNRLQTLRRHWPIAIAGLVFLLGATVHVNASTGQMPTTTGLLDTPIFVLSVFTVVLIVAALVLTNMHRKTLTPKASSKIAPKTTPKKKSKSK